MLAAGVSIRAAGGRVNGYVRVGEGRPGCRRPPPSAAARWLQRCAPSGGAGSSQSARRGPMAVSGPGAEPLCRLQRRRLGLRAARVLWVGMSSSSFLQAGLAAALLLELGGPRDPACRARFPDLLCRLVLARSCPVPHHTCIFSFGLIPGRRSSFSRDCPLLHLRCPLTCGRSSLHRPVLARRHAHGSPAHTTSHTVHLTPHASHHVPRTTGPVRRR